MPFHGHKCPLWMTTLACKDSMQRCKDLLPHLWQNDMCNVLYFCTYCAYDGGDVHSDYFLLHYLTTSPVLYRRLSFVFQQWTAAQIGRWTTWSIECFRVSQCDWSALCSMGTSGPIIARLRVWASVSCGTAALAWATATSRSPFLSMARVWARRRMPFGSGPRTFRTLDFIPVSYGRSTPLLMHVLMHSAL